MSLYDAEEILRAVNSTLWDAVKGSKISVLDEVGFLLDGWEIHGIQLDQKNVLLPWSDVGEQFFQHDFPRVAFSRQEDAVNEISTTQSRMGSLKCYEEFLTINWN